MNKNVLNKKSIELNKSKLESLGLSLAIQKLTGKLVSGNKYDCECPICGKKKATIKTGDTYIYCNNAQCVLNNGSVRKVFDFIVKYMEVKHKLCLKDIELFKRIDDIFNTSFINNYNMKYKGKQEKSFDKTYLINHYATEKEEELFQDWLENKRMILNSPTGTGKTYLMKSLSYKMVNKGVVDVNFILVPRVAIVDEIKLDSSKLANESNDTSKEFYKMTGNTITIPYEVKNGKIEIAEQHIVATTHKARAINQELYNYKTDYERTGRTFKYSVMIDECHLLHSARNIIGQKNEIERIIDNADYLILTSANTNFCYISTKEHYNIKKYIALRQKEEIYNLDDVEIVRYKSKFRESVLDNLCNEMTSTFHKYGMRNILFIWNDIKMLEELSKRMSAKGISTSVLKSENKEENENYEILLNDKSLQQCVTFATSVIDTGISIKDTNVTTILVQELFSFDDIAITQSLARVRTNISNYKNARNNAKVILLQDDKENISENPSPYFEIEREQHEEQTCIKRNELSEILFDNFEEYEKDNKSYFEMIKARFTFLMQSDYWSSFKGVLYLTCNSNFTNPRIEVDKIAIDERLRKAELIKCYYNDEYVVSLFNGVKSKNRPVMCEPVIVKGFDEAEETKVIDPVRYAEEVQGILGRKVHLDMLLKHFTNDKSKKKEAIEDELIPQMEYDYKSADNWYEFTKKLIRTNEFGVKRSKVKSLDILKATLSNELETNKNKKSNKKKQMEYILLNNLYGKEFEYEYAVLKYDNNYELVRSILDSCMKKRNAIKKSYFELIAREMLEKSSKAKEQKLNKEEYQKALTKYTKKAKEIVNMIYNVSDKNFISLKVKLD